MSYILYIDNKPQPHVNSLDEAKQLAVKYMIKRLRLRIESYVAPAPSQIWIYDYKIEDWVEQK